MPTTDRLRLPSELKFQEELELLTALDAETPRPEGWALSPQAVLRFILGGTGPLVGSAKAVITPKFFGDRSLVEAAISTLASDRALLLVGPPGTAKSMLSEWLAAAISGSSRLIVQGSSGITEDQIKYSWNYALLLKEGPTEVALKPSPILEGMQRGTLVRLEEMTRLVSEVQDCLISVLSEKEIAIPEMGNRVVMARKGFNVIATANTLDRGVNEMSSALRRRFNFVHVGLVDDFDTEVQIVSRRTRELMADYRVTTRVPDDLIKMLVTLYSELRQGRSIDRELTLKKPSTDLSSAQAIATLFNSCISASFFEQGVVSSEGLARWVTRAFSREAASDTTCLREYAQLIARQRNHGQWPAFLGHIQRMTTEA